MRSARCCSLLSDPAEHVTDGRREPLPPRAVGLPRSLRALAMARSEVAPLACSSVITGARSAARLASAPFWRAFAVSLAPARKPPSFLPRRLATVSAALVRSEIKPASSSATRAQTHGIPETPLRPERKTRWGTSRHIFGMRGTGIPTDEFEKKGTPCPRPTSTSAQRCPSSRGRGRYRRSPAPSRPS